MNLDRKLRNLIKISSNVFILFLLLHLFITPVLASDSLTLHINSVSGENFSAKVLIDTKGDSNPDLLIGDEKDYAALNLPPPVFLKSLYVTLTTTYEGNKRIAYVQSKTLITAIDFSLVLKLLTSGSPIIESFNILMPLPLEKYIKSKSDSKISSNKDRDYALSFTPFFRKTRRNLIVGSDKAKSEVTLLITRLEIAYKKKFAAFFDVGYGILKIKDSVPFSGLSITVNMDNFDGGRAFAIGGGVSAKIIDTKMLDLEIMFNVTRFEKNAESVSLKVISSDADVLWSEYTVSAGTTFKINKYFNPIVAVTYSEIVGDFTLNQSLFGVSSSEKKSLDEDASLGAVVGFVSKPYNALYITVVAELVNQLGYKVALSFNF